MAPTKSAGRVSIRVLPDTTGFRRDLKTALDRIERGMKVEIPVHLKLGREQIAEIKRQIEQAVIQIKPDVYLNLKREELERVKREVEALDAKMQVGIDLDTARAQARIASLTRARSIPVFVRVMGMNFAKHLAALGGLGFITEEVKRGLRYLREIDKNAVILAKQAMLFGTLIAGIGSATQAVLGLGDGLIKTVGILTVAPALMSSIGIAVAVFASVLRDMGEVLGDLKPQFSELRRTMSRTFWQQAEAPIRKMVEELFPTMAEKITESSRLMGLLTGQIADSYRTHVTVERLSLMWDRVNKSMDTVRGAVDPIIEAFTYLGLHGTKYLDRLSKSIVKLSEDFKNFIKDAYYDGRLEQWTEDAIQAFKDLGGIIAGVWRTFGALNKAAKEAGGPTLSIMRENLDKLQRQMNSPGFQVGMTRVFRGMNEAVREIARGIRDMGPGMLVFSQTAQEAFGALGRAVRTVLGYLGDTLRNPIFNKGVTDLFKGIEKGIKALEPAIEPTAVALGSLFTLMGHLLERLGGLIGLIMDRWGPALQRLSDEFDTLVDPVMDLVEALVIELTPAVNALIDEALIPLLGWLRDDILPVLTEYIKDKGPALAEMFEAIGSMIVILLPILTQLLEGFLLITGGVFDLIGALTEFRNTMLDPAESPIVKFAQLVGVKMAEAKRNFDIFTEYLLGEWSEKFNTWVDNVDQFLIGLQLLISQDWETIVAIFRQSLEDIGIDTTNGMTIVESIWDIALGNMLDEITNKGAAIIHDWRMKLEEMGIDTSTKTSTILGTIRVGFGTIMDIIKRNGESAATNFGRSLGNMLSNSHTYGETIKQVMRNKMGEMGRGVQDAWNNTIEWMRSIPGRIEMLFNINWWSVGARIVNNIAQGIRDAAWNAIEAARNLVQRIRDHFPFSPAKTGPFSGYGYTRYSGRAMIRDWAKGMHEEMGSAAKVLSDSMQSINSQFTLDGGIELPQQQDRGNVTMNVYNPVREPTSRTVAKTAAEIRLGGTIG